MTCPRCRSHVDRAQGVVVDGPESAVDGRAAVTGSPEVWVWAQTALRTPHRPSREGPPMSESRRYRPDVVASWVGRVRVRVDGIEGRVVACHDGPAVLVQADDGTRRWYPAETAARAGLHCVDCDPDLGMHGMLGCWQPVDEGVCECRQWVERR